MACVAGGFRLSAGAVLAEVGAPEMKNKQLRDAPAVEERGDGRKDTLTKMGEEVLRHEDGEDRQKREEEEEKESKLVAGISPDDEKEAEDGEKSVEDINAKQEGSVEREKEDRTAINNLTPPLKAPHLWEASKSITRSPNPPSSRRHVVSASEGPASLASPGEVRSGSPVLTREALQQPGHGQHSEDINRLSQAETSEFPSKKQIEAPKMSQVGSMADPLKAKGANFTRNLSGDKKVEEVKVRKWSPLREQVLKSTGKRNQTSPQQQNGGSKHKNMTGSREKKKMNRTPNVLIRKQDTPPTHFPYFLDDYCPPECACYGR